MKLGRKLILGLIVLLILYASLFAGFSIQAQQNITVENIVTQTSNTLRQSVRPLTKSSTVFSNGKKQEKGKATSNK